MGALINKSIEFGDHIDGLSQKLNISAESVQLWDTVLKNNKSSLDENASGFQNVNSMAYSAGMGIRKSAMIFNQLGVEVKDANGSLRDQNEILNDTIFALADVKNNTLQAALAQKLGLQGMLPTLRQGTEAIKEQLEQAREYGILTGENAAKLAAAKDKMDHFKTSTAILSAEFTTTFIPALGAGAEWLAKFLAKFPKMVRGETEAEKAISHFKNEITELTGKIKEYEAAATSAEKAKIFNEATYKDAPDRLKWLNEQIKKIDGPGNTPTGSGNPLVDPEAAKKKAEEAAKAAGETWARISKEINQQVREENYAETQK
jgi:hypothetical protein